MNFAKLDWSEKRDLLEKLPKQKIVYLAADFAKAILPKFEGKFPNDLRPRQAIEAVYNGLSPEDCCKAANAAADVAAYTTADAAAHAAYATANAAWAAAHADYAAANWGTCAAVQAAQILPELVNEIYEASRITIPKHLYTHDIRLMFEKAWEGENTIPYIADALEELGFETKELRKSKFYGRSHGIFNYENV